jgi:hypothetical protein
MAATFDKVEATTIQVYVDRTFYDQFFNGRPLFKRLKGKTKTLSGGTEIRVPLMHAANSTAGSYSGYDQLDVSPQQPFSNAAYQWKQYSVSITYSGREQTVNRGEAEILDLIEGLTMNARESLFNNMSTDSFGDGTGNGGKALSGLAIHIDSTGTLGGINQSNQSWWASTEDAMGGALTLAAMRNTYNDITQGEPDDGATFIVTTQNVHEAYEGLLQPDMRYSSTDKGDGSFKNLLFRGTPIFFDPACTSQVMYFINEKYLQFRVASGREFKTTEFIRPANQDAWVSQVLFMGELVTTARRKHGTLTGITG